MTVSCSAFVALADHDVNPLGSLRPTSLQRVIKLKMPLLLSARE